MTTSRVRLAAIAIAVTVAGGVGRAEPLGTTIEVTPPSAPPGGTFHITGTSDCSVMWGTLYYVDYGGQQQQATGEDNSAEFNKARDKSEYEMDIHVPADAAPGKPARAYTDSACGSHDDLPPSEVVKVEIDFASPRLVASPAVVRPGGRVSVVGSGCYGSGSVTVPVAVGWPGGSVEVAARRSGDRFSGSVTVPVSAGLGAGRVTLLDSADCPGSYLPASAGFRVGSSGSRPVRSVAPGRSPSVFARPVRPVPSASRSGVPSRAVSASPTRSESPPPPSHVAREGGGDDRGAGGRAAVALALLAGAGAGAVTMLVRRRRAGAA